MKKYKIITLILLVLFFLTFNPMVVSATNSQSNYQNLIEEIEELVSSLNLEELESYLKDITQSLTNGEDVKNILLNMIKGEMPTNFSNLGEYIFSTLFSGVKNKLPTFITIFLLLIISVIINSIKADKLGSSYEIVHFACFSVIICIVCSTVYALISEAQRSIEITGKIVQGIFPIMLTLMTVTGSSASVAVYNPAVLFITDFAVIIVNKLIFPIILGMLAISIISNLCKTVKLNGFLNFSSSALKWIIGLVSTIFALFLTVRGLNSGVYDGITIRALKYTVNSSIPIVGGILRDGLDLILASGVLVKNALGSLAILIIFGNLVTPIIEIACVTLALRIVNAITEPLNDPRTGNFINSVCSIVNFVTASIIIVSFMYVIVIILAICSSNSIF